MYLWHILNRNKSEVIRRIYETQKLNNNIGDWIKLVESDKKELEITMEEEEIQGVSKEIFKNYVKSKVKINHLKQLNNMKVIQNQNI